MPTAIYAILLTISHLLVSPGKPNGPLARVPFIGCESDGQLGPTKAPSGESRTLAIPPVAAERLAYYQAQQGQGVLAPRGWHCFATLGSSGEALYVAPEPIRFADLTSDKWSGFTGPAIQISIAEGGTSGRFEVARVIARVFPAHYAFVEHVIAEGIEPATEFPHGPYPKDKLKYVSQNVVEFTTPANRKGLGTMSRLRKNAVPIRGFVILYPGDTDLLQLSVRLGFGDEDLANVILEEAEQKAQESLR